MPNLEMLPAPGSPALGLMAWLLTYALHSTLLGAGVWLATTLFSGHALRETLWKSALVGGLLTTTLQMGLGVEPLGGRLTLPARSGGTSISAALPGTSPWAADSATPTGAADSAASLAVINEDNARALRPSGHPAGLGETSASAAMPHSAPPATSPDPTRRSAASPGPHVDLATQISLLKDAPGMTFPSLSWGHLMLFAWLAGALFALVRLLRGRARFLAGLGPRYPVVSGVVFDSLVRLRKRAGIRKPVHLTRSARLTSPVALGSHEICLPDRALIELNRRQQEGMLAHELAHLARRDPLWLVISGVIESLFFFQPFNALGRRHLQESTEFMADEWAVQQTGRRLTLARSLAQVASWLEQKQQPAALAPMARLGSPLLRRIHRLLDERPAATPRRPRLLLAAAILPLLAVATLAPAVSGDGAAPAATETEEVRPTLAAEASGDGGEGSGMRFEGRSNWIHNDDDRRFSMDVDGEVQFSRDGKRIESMSPGTTLSLRDRQGGHDRRLEVIADDNGLPSYEYRVNGREEPFEPDGRVFLEETVQELSRRHEDARLRRAEAAERRAEAAERRAEMMVQRDEARRYRDEIVRAEREMSREMRSQSQELRREVYEMDSELRRQDRERAMAYREAARELQSAQRQEDMDMRRQLREDQVDVQREASEAFRQAEQLMRDAERADPEDREAAVEDARAAMETAQRVVEEMQRDLEQRQMEMQQQREENSQHREEDLERLQRDMEETTLRNQQEREMRMQEQQRQLEDQQLEMERRREELHRDYQERLENEAGHEPSEVGYEPAEEPLVLAHPAPLPPMAAYPAMAVLPDAAPLPPMTLTPRIVAAPVAPMDVSPRLAPAPDVAPLPTPALPGQYPTVMPAPAMAPQPSLVPQPSRLSPPPAPPRAEPMDRPDQAPPAPPALTAPAATPSPPDFPDFPDVPDAGDSPDSTDEPAPEPDRG